MRAYVRLARPQRHARAAWHVPRAAARSRSAAEATVGAERNAPLASLPISLPTGTSPDPYVDYGRFLTPEGGVLFVYKDFDVRFRHSLWRWCAWTVATGIERWLLLNHSPVESGWINVIALLIVAAINCRIVAKPVEIYRRIEIRPDGVILDGRAFFSLALMNGLPAFQPNKVARPRPGWLGWLLRAIAWIARLLGRVGDEDSAVLSGIYGTRLVEYLTARRFDDNDRTPDVFAAHVQEAMTQLWGPALGLETARSGAPQRQSR